MSTQSDSYNPLAQNLNQIIDKHPSTNQLLSNIGRRIFYPTKGIVAQSSEAKKKSNPIHNATVGIAIDRNGPLSFKSIEKFYNLNHINPYQIFDYTGSFGNPQLRKLWKERLYEINPNLKGKQFSLPIVTGGLTNALSICADLFFDPNDTLILPDQIWGNYRLVYETIRRAKLKFFSFFQEKKFNLDSFKKSLQEESKIKKEVRILLNFPNNPTGYSPTKEEANQIVKTLIQLAEEGNKVLVVLDEAYHGLFFETNLIHESIFTQLTNAHENILTVKICGATKEFFMWGFRVGFITFGTKSATPELYEALEMKAGGLIRGNISNVSTSAQYILTSILEDKSYIVDSKKNFTILKERALEVKKILSERNEYKYYFEAYPFNSGYFMLLNLKNGVESEFVRKKLLDEEIGTISTAKHDLRVAFSCIEKGNLSYIFDKIYRVCKILSKSSYKSV